MLRDRDNAPQSLELAASYGHVILYRYTLHLVCLTSGRSVFLLSHISTLYIRYVSPYYHPS